MPGQWEYQIGPLGPLESGDQMWLSRWLLYRIAEDYGVSATLHPKPVKGDWNGAGAHKILTLKPCAQLEESKLLKQHAKN